MNHNQTRRSAGTNIGLRNLCLAAAVMMIPPVTTTQATVLIFQSPNGVFGLNHSVAYYPKTIDSGLGVYGDHVNAIFQGTATHPFAFEYGNNGEGFTPNIGISYSPGDPNSDTTANPPSYNPTPAFAGNFYGDLGNGIYQVNFPNTVADLTLGITFTADPGYRVSLQGFQLAAYANGTNILEQLSVVVDGVTNSIGSNLAINQSTHSSFDFSASPYTGKQVEILMDGRDLTYWGGNSTLAISSFSDIDIGNIIFAQIPEPSTLPLLLLSVSWILTGRMRKRLE